MRFNALAAVAFVALFTVSFSAFGARMTCESPNYQRNYCPAGERISSVRLVRQQSNAPCIQGRTWDHDGRGIWVTQGCSAEFDFKRSGGGGGRQIACASRGYDRQFCPSERRIARAWLIEQRSRATCAQGRTWGFQGDGVWVSGGCNGLFGVEERHSGPANNRVACESRGFQYAFCSVARSIRRAWVDQQRSQSPCIQGQTWGFQPNGIWVDRGCSAVFAFEAR